MNTRVVVNLNKIKRKVNIHEYTLRRDVVELGDGPSATGDTVISIGKHGMMNASPAHDRAKNPGDSESSPMSNSVAAHNIAEMKRAMEEGAKWEIRLKESPLGKTQQDFVAYYREVITVFTGWCAEHGILLPDERS